MTIHEKTLVSADQLLTEGRLVIDGVDVSGQWNTMILPRTLTDYDDEFERKIESYRQAENLHRCWQCGSCTNSCTVYAVNTDFNPRYWIYLVRLGLKDELLKDKDIIWQCVSCNKCTNICPKDVRPEGVMKALAHWIEDEGYGAKSRSSVFDEEFTEQCYARGRIEDIHLLEHFLMKTKQALSQPWLVLFGQRLMKHLPLKHMTRLGLHFLFAPRTKSWGCTGEVLKQYVREQKAAGPRA